MATQLENEQRVLTFLLTRWDRIPQVNEVLTRLAPEHSSVQRHIDIYRAMQELHELGQPTDDLTVGTYMYERGRIDSNGVAYIVGLSTLCGTVEDGAFYADLVAREHAV